MKTVTGLFDNYEDASGAVAELEANGVPDSDISIVANNSTGWYDGDGSARDTSDAGEDAASGAGVGAVLGGAGGLLAGLGIIAIPGVGPVVAAGWLAATAVGAIGGAAVGGAAGGIIGALTESGVPERDAHAYAEGVRRGGTLVSARVADELADIAERILRESRSVDLAERRREYEAGGWTGFDADAETYTADEMAGDRARRANRI
ncbi:general stress protein [Mesorhizobium sp. BAC0120]|uniref:general stress protein n=1 Tax=Mesorhizobium sp. BAC0120 TaxID=3090670 RepID=UPI00298C2A94|nr:general stress protein [Mesorhizobium sp. BAC0120]MDW6026622.1 general stress protein [Mesorhizobium sp. BAC0120]